MANVLVERAYLEDIGDALREKLQESNTYLPSEMAAAVLRINTGGTPDVGPKTVSANGRYAASSDDLDGYDVVNVGVWAQTVQGWDPTDDEEYIITINPYPPGPSDDPVITKTKLPQTIAVTTPPTKTVYRPGETIDLTGIVVHAYYEDGSDWGVVPTNELSHSPSTSSSITEDVTIAWNRIGDNKQLTTTQSISQELPTYITIITPPSKLVYNAGEPIYLSGIRVDAYYEDDTNWGVVPVNQLIPSPSVASGGTPGALEQMSWSEISAIAIAGTGDTYFDIGEAKSITLNGQIGDGLTLDNYNCSVFILDFNHVDNGVADNNIIFGGFKYGSNHSETITVSWNRGDGQILRATYRTKDGIKDVALCDSNYMDSKFDGTKCFNMNHWGGLSSPNNTNYGGWKGCDLRYDILGGTSTQPSGYGSTKTTSCVGYDATAATITTPVTNTLMAALPSDFRNVLRLHTHYVDNKGNKSNVDANVTAVVDAIFLLAEFEVFGTRGYANQYEQNHQTQMTYYSRGNSKIKYKHNATSTACWWWVSSPCSSYVNFFRFVYTDGSSSIYNSYLSGGLAPAFKV